MIIVENYCFSQQYVIRITNYMYQNIKEFQTTNNRMGEELKSIYVFSNPKFVEKSKPMFSITVTVGHTMTLAYPP